MLQAFGDCALVQPKSDDEQATPWVSVKAVFYRLGAGTQAG